MCAVEANQGIGGIAEAEERAANFQIQIALRGACDTDLPQVEDEGKKKHEGDCAGSDQHLPVNILRSGLTAVAAEKPDNLATTTHKIPPNTNKKLPTSEECKFVPFSAQKSVAVIR